MKTKVALLIDGEWLRRRLEDALKGKLPNGVTADVMYRNALLSLTKDEELFRIFYYDCLSGQLDEDVDSNPCAENDWRSAFETIFHCSECDCYATLLL